MRNERLDAILAAAKPLFAEHWAMCRESGLMDHSTEAHAAVDRCFQDYIKALEALPEPADKAAIMEVIKNLFANLDDIIQEFGDGLLETDERELLCAPIIDAAEAAGLRLADFDDADPTQYYRNF